MALLDDLQTSRDETLRYFALHDADLARNYGPGKWDVRHILHHLADAEIVLYDRISRVISEPRQVLLAFDQEAWCAGLDYKNRPLEISRDLYRSARNGLMHYAKLYYESHGDREFVHSKTGVRTLKMEFDKVAEHNEGHLGHIRQALR